MTRTTTTTGESAPNGSVSRAPAAGGGDRRNRAAWISLIGAAGVLGLKFVAYLVTGSVGLLSDAAESLVNLVAAGVLLIALAVSQAPPDYRHPYGHTKAEYFSSVLEAALIILAAAFIAVTAVQRLLAPVPLTNVAAGVSVAILAGVANGALALYLFRIARAERSAALDANARHILTDVYTSAGVVVGVVLAKLTGWEALDPILGLAVAANIIRVGVRVLQRSLSELLDERLPEEEEAVILKVLESTPGIYGFHRLRTRRSGRARFMEVDVFVDRKLSVEEGHALVGRLEDAIHAHFEDLVTTIHMEPYLVGVRDKTQTPRDEFGEPTDGA